MPVLEKQVATRCVGVDRPVQVASTIKVVGQAEGREKRAHVEVEHAVDVVPAARFLQQFPVGSFREAGVD